MSEQIKEKNWRLSIARFLIAAVIGWNLQVAYVFLLYPERFVSGFELSGAKHHRRSGHPNHKKWG